MLCQKCGNKIDKEKQKEYQDKAFCFACWDIDIFLKELWVRDKAEKMFGQKEGYGFFL